MTRSITLIPVREAARRLGVSATTLRHLIRERRIAAVRLGRELRVTEAALEAFACGGAP